MGKLIVTGANGFIGSHLVNFLVAHSKYDILAVDHQQGLREEYVIPHDRVLYITSEKFYNELERFSQVDGIFHLGAISSTTEKDWAKINLYNIYLSRILIDFAQEHSIHLVFASSASLYGHSVSFGCSDVGQVFSLYAYSKLAIEKYLMSLVERDNAEIVALRLFNVYGEHEQHKHNQASPYFKFRVQAENDEDIILFKHSGDFLRDFVAVEDVVALMYRVFEKRVVGLFNLGTGEAISFESVAQAIADEYQADIQWVEMPNELKLHYQIYTKSDNRSLLKEVGEWKFVGILDKIRK